MRGQIIAVKCVCNEFIADVEVPENGDRVTINLDLGNYNITGWCYGLGRRIMDGLGYKGGRVTFEVGDDGVLPLNYPIPVELYEEKCYNGAIVNRVRLCEGE